MIFEFPAGLTRAYEKCMSYLIVGHVSEENALIPYIVQTQVVRRVRRKKSTIFF
jgi:hypothetical protein